MQNERTDVHVITPDETESKVRKLPMSNEELREWESWARDNCRDEQYRIRDRKR